MKRQFFSLLASVISFGCLIDGAIADTLTTKGFKIDIEVNCEEGNVTCNLVRLFILSVPMG
jgi:hypothetical protein